MPLLRSHAPTGTMMNSLLAGKGGSSSARALDPCRIRARSSVYVYRSTVIYVQAYLVRERHDGAAGATTSSPRHPFPAVFCTACLSPLSGRGKTIPLRGFDESPTSSLPSGSSTSFLSLDRIKTPSFLPSTSPLSLPSMPFVMDERVFEPHFPKDTRCTRARSPASLCLQRL